MPLDFDGAGEIFFDAEDRITLKDVCLGSYSEVSNAPHPLATIASPVDPHIARQTIIPDGRILAGRAVGFKAHSTIQTYRPDVTLSANSVGWFPEGTRNCGKRSEVCSGI